MAKGKKMIGEPRIEERKALPYVGIRTQVPIKKLGATIRQLSGELFSWLGKQGVAPDGAPFIRYHVIDMERLMDVEVGIPVAKALTGDERVSAGALPPGRYASLVYIGVGRGFSGNKALLEWGASQGLVWDKWATDKGDAFGGRVEFFLTDPAEEPDRKKWETEVAIRLAAG
jgi:effector-binding domain-containing protein